MPGGYSRMTTEPYAHYDYIAANLQQVRQAVARAAEAAKRDPAQIKLIAVSKFHPAEAVMAAIKAGQHEFGENRVQEGKKKFTELAQIYPAMMSTPLPPLCLNLIGPLQTNKALEAVMHFHTIQSLDRPKLAASLQMALQKAKPKLNPNLYIEVNIGKEPQKAGIMPEDLAAFLTECKQMPELKINGLMCIPPQGQNPVPYFNLLRQLAERHALPHLSMGMSADYTEAIAAGATEIRLGTAIFGQRQI